MQKTKSRKKGDTVNNVVKEIKSGCFLNAFSMD